MSSQPAPASAPMAAESSRRNDPARYFYLAAGVLMLVVAITGFRHFYLEGKSYPGRPITPPIRGLIIAHGVLMSAWIVLLIVQPFLVATRRVRAHMALGKVGAVMAVAIVVLGFLTATKSVQVAPPDMMFGPLTPKQFMSVPYTTVVLFAVFIGIGLWKRNRPAIHRPFMFLATLIAIGAAMDRIDFIRNLYIQTIFFRVWSSYFSTLLLGTLLWAIKCGITRSIDRWFGLGLLVFWIVCGVMTQLAPTPVWDAIASLFV